MVTSKSNSKSENIKREFPVFFIKPLTTPKNRESIASFLLEFTKSALNRSEFVELENSADYIEFLVGQVIEEHKGREKMKECLKRKNDN